MRFLKNVSLYLLLAILLALGVACKKAVSDSDLSSQVQTKFKDDSGLQDKQISVDTANGVVTLSGKVDNDTERIAASRYASSVPGIQQVVNNLEIEQPRAQSRKTSALQPAVVPPTKKERHVKPTPVKETRHKRPPRNATEPQTVAESSAPPL